MDHELSGVIDVLLHFEIVFEDKLMARTKRHSYCYPHGVQSQKPDYT
jgi:hypothetical protein